MHGGLVWLLIGLLISAAGLAGGCAARTAPLTVTIRDSATREPVAGVKVVADVAARDHPFSVGSLLGQTGPISTSGVTDARGQVVVEHLPDHPVRICALARGCPVLVGVMHPARSGLAALITRADPAVGVRGLEAEIEAGKPVPR